VSQPLCTLCLLPHPQGEDLRECVDAQALYMKKLLQLVGEPGICRYCGATIYWLQHRTGAKAPYTVHGLNHFINCANVPGRAKQA